MYPVKGRQLTKQAETAGLTASSLPTLLVEGDNKPGLAHAIAQTIAPAGINLGFLVAQGASLLLPFLCANVNAR